MQENNSQQAEELANIVRSDIVKVPGRKCIKFLNDYDEADEEERRRLSLAISNEVMRKNKYWQFRHHNNCGSTLPSMATSERKQIASFMNPAMMGSQDMMNGR